LHAGSVYMPNFSRSFFGVFCGRAIHPTAKVSEEVNRKLPARNTSPSVQLLTLNTDPERQNTQRYRRTDRRTDSRHYDENSRLYCVTEKLFQFCFSTSRTWDNIKTNPMWAWLTGWSHL